MNPHPPGPCLIDEVSQVGSRRELTVLPHCPRMVCELCPRAASSFIQPWPLPLATSSVIVSVVPHSGQQGGSQGYTDEHLRKWTGLANHTPLPSQPLFGNLHWLLLACRVRWTLTCQAAWGESFAFVPICLPLYLQAPHPFPAPAFTCDLGLLVASPGPSGSGLKPVVSLASWHSLQPSSGATTIRPEITTLAVRSCL